MKTSDIGRAVLTAREGARLTAYRDSVGVLTIGCGHTGRTSPPAVFEGMTITTAQADAYLAADLAPIETAINKVVTVPLADNEFDALVSFAFNIGISGFEGSTVVRRLNASDRAGAADAFSLWEKPASLASRREAERSQFLTPYAKAMPIARIGETPISAPSPTVAPPVLQKSPDAMPPKLSWLQKAWIALTFRKAA